MADPKQTNDERPQPDEPPPGQAAQQVQDEALAQQDRERLDRKLDEAIQMTFPASDPIAI